MKRKNEIRLTIIVSITNLLKKVAEARVKRTRDEESDDSSNENQISHTGELAVLLCR